VHSAQLPHKGVGDVPWDGRVPVALNDKDR
jgi:hypothetical protein